MPSPLLTARSLRAVGAALEPDAPVTLGVISNPFSRRNARGRLHDRLIPRFVPARENAVHTRTVADLDAALRRLLLDRGVNVLALNGGDGTLHLAVNRLLALRTAIRGECGLDLPLPRLMFLNGGTLNIVARALGHYGTPIRSLRRFVRRFEGRRLCDIPVRSLDVLEVRGADRPPRYGFVFGSELVANALEMYTRFGEGYPGLARFLGEVGLGYLLNTRIWQEHGWKLDPPRTPVVVDRIVYPRYCAAVASTIDLSLAKGAVTAIRTTSGPGFFVKVVLETDKGRVIRLIPRLMVGGSHPAIKDVPDATELALSGSYTLDGECFIDRSPAGARCRLQVGRAPVALDAVSPP